jgi:hypothetical protein
MRAGAIKEASQRPSCLSLFASNAKSAEGTLQNWVVLYLIGLVAHMRHVLFFD